METIILYLLRAPVILISLTVHEFFHGYVAKLLGDDTAANQGRLSLNPIRHLEPIGTILLFVTGFGWAKPVPINPLYFRGDRNKGVLLVSAAGPASNIILSLIAAMLMKFIILLNINNVYLSTFIFQLILINVGLAIFNLIPIPPLDGSKILASLLPPNQRNIIYQLENYGTLLLIVILFWGGKFISPLVSGIIKLESVIFGLNLF